MCAKTSSRPQKKRAVVSYANMSPELAAAFKEKVIPYTASYICMLYPLYLRNTFVEFQQSPVRVVEIRAHFWEKATLPETLFTYTSVIAGHSVHIGCRCPHI